MLSHFNMSLRYSGTFWNTWRETLSANCQKTLQWSSTYGLSNCSVMKTRQGMEQTLYCVNCCDVLYDQWVDCPNLVPPFASSCLCLWVQIQTTLLGASSLYLTSALDVWRRDERTQGGDILSLLLFTAQNHLQGFYEALRQLAWVGEYNLLCSRGFNSRRPYFNLYSVAWCCRLIGNMESWILIILVLTPGKAIHSLNQCLANTVNLIKFKLFSQIWWNCKKWQLYNVKHKRMQKMEKS